MATTSVPEPRVSVSDYQKGFLILRIYLKAMAFAFTGGMAATPQLMYDITQKHKLLTEDEYTEIIALSNSLPGIIGVNNGYFTGKRIAGNFGAAMAIAGTVFPAFLSMIIVAILFRQLPESRIMRGAINGIRAVSIAVLAQTGVNIILKNKSARFSRVMIVAALLIPLLTPIGAFYTILFCGACGILYLRFADRSAGSQRKEEA